MGHPQTQAGEPSLLASPLPHIEEAGCVYLDYNGTTPIFPEVAAAMVPFLHAHGNPSSSHVYGRQVRDAAAYVPLTHACMRTCVSEAYHRMCQ